MPSRDRFEGDYVMGGQSTLYMTRQDVVKTLAMLKLKYPGQIQQLLREANERVKEVRDAANQKHR